MFLTVRHWWGSGRGKVTLRLFIFELFVVTLGVLLAQWLSSWAADRAHQQEVTKEYQRLRFETGRARQAATVWIAAAPCLRARVDLLVRAASAPDRLKLTDRDIAMPRIGIYRIDPIFDDVERAFRDRYGDDLTDIYGGLVNATQNLNNNAQEVASQWATFGYLAPELDSPDQFDRAAIRAAGVRLRYLLRRIEGRSNGVIDGARRLGIAPIGSGKALAIPDNPVTNCAEIWRNGHIWHVGK